MTRTDLLSLAFELPAEVYPVGALRIRPYRLAAHGRAERLQLLTAAAGIEAARDVLPPTQFYRELDALYWLLSADLDVVRGTFRTRGVAGAWLAIDAQTLPPASVADFTAEMALLFAMVRASLFDVDDRPTPGDTSPPPSPPDDLIAPGLTATMIIALSERLRLDETQLLEWLPFPRIQQYAHAMQFTNPTIWTVAPRALAPDPYADGVAPDPGVGEAIAF